LVKSVWFIIDAVLGRVTNGEHKEVAPLGQKLKINRTFYKEVTPLA